MLTPKFWGILKKRDMFQEIEVQKLRERWCAYNEKSYLYIPSTSIQFSWGALSKTNFGALLSSNMCWKNPTFFHYKKPTFQFRYHELDLGWLVSWVRRCGWNEGFFFRDGKTSYTIWEHFPRIYFLFILIFYLLRSGCNLKTCEFCDCFLFRVVKKIVSLNQSPKKLQGWKSWSGS